MANNDDNSNSPRRNRDRPEDNPFIAFRRFADSQVSSLLNTVFTLPATIANYNNIHVAREACLFNKGDKMQCDKLEQIENEIAKLRREGQELCRGGELHEVLKKSEEVMQLDRRAEELRRDIVEQSGGKADETAMVQRVANQKGQEWGWDWSWGFPKPFDDDSQSSQPSPNARDRYTEPWRQLEAEARRVFGDEVWETATRNAVDAMEASPLVRGFLGDAGWDELRNAMNGARSTDQRYSPDALESNDRMQRTGVNWREAYEDLVRAEEEDRQADCRGWRDHSRAKAAYPKRVPWMDESTDDEPSYEYAHDHEDQHDEPPSPKVSQRDGWCGPAQGQTASENRDLQKFLSDQQQQNGRCLGLRDNVDSGESPLDSWCRPADNQTTSDKRDIQSYLREQQQNGRHLGLYAPAETELDVYEQMYEKANASKHSTTPAPTNDTPPSILSTLTTTERTVAPDGSVTTKVILKKRFADGREQSTETVHTQRGHERDPWASSQMASGSTSKAEDGQDKGKKWGGWFWSS
jgi:hypothetical protein